MKSYTVKATILGLMILTKPVWAENAPAPALTVATVTPEVQIWAETQPASGRLEPWQQSVISAEINGQHIIEMNVDTGSQVQKGDVLARLSSETIENNIRQQEAAVESARAALDQASGDSARARGLTASGAISEQQITSYLVTERRAQADLASAEAALAYSMIDLDRTSINAIDDGLISSRSAALGDVVSAGTQLFTLIRQNRIEWQAEVPQRRLDGIENGTRAVIPTPFGDVQGQVRLVEPTSSGTSGRVKTYVALDIPEGARAPQTGVLVSGYFHLGESEALTLPTSAISLRDGFTYVFTLNGTNPETVSRNRVTTGRQKGEHVEILTGLNADADVVEAGGAFLAHGSIVHVAPSLTASAETVDQEITE